jgi:hypothetical protein
MNILLTNKLYGNPVARLITEVFETTAQVGPFSGKIRTWESVGRAYERLYCRCVEGDS